MVESQPVYLDQVVNNSNWLASMQEELMEIEKNKTFELLEKSIEKPIDVKWVYKLKLRPNGEIYKHKARLVVISFLQKPGIDFEKVYAPITRLETIKIIVLTAVYKGWEIHQLDVKPSFLNGPLEEEVYVSQPPGFGIKGKLKKVYILRKTLYGLKHAQRAWNKRIYGF